MKIKYTGKKAYRFIYKDNLIILKPGQVFNLPVDAAKKIKGSKFNKYFKKISDEPTDKELLKMARKQIKELEKRIALLEINI